VAAPSPRDRDYAAGQSARPAGPHGFFAPVTPDEVASAFVFASKHLGHSSGLMDSGWRFSSPDQTLLEMSARQGHLHWWHGRQALLSTYEDDEDAEPVLAIGFLALLQLSNLSRLLQDAAHLAQAGGYAAVHWLAPTGDDVQAALRAAGYTSDWDHSGFLYARRHPGT
jgi:hypothetical protein